MLFPLQPIPRSHIIGSIFLSSITIQIQPGLFSFSCKHRIGSRDYPDIIYPPRAQNFSRLNPDAKKMPGDSCSWQPTDELRHNFYQTTHYMIRLRNREVFCCCWGMSGLRATNCWNIWKLLKKKKWLQKLSILQISKTFFD